MFGHFNVAGASVLAINIWSRQGFWAYSLACRSLQGTQMNALPSTSVPKYVRLLGYGGLLPFIFLAILMPFSHDYRPLIAVALVNYGAVILSFVGALHWGFAMTVQDMSARQRRDRFIWSVIPSLIAWMATLLPMPLGCLLLVVGFVAHLGQDRQLSRMTSLPDWYLPIRLLLTLVASMCLLLAALVEMLHL
jgi:hypothetical protein